MELLQSKGPPWSAFLCKRRSPHLIVLCVFPLIFSPSGCNTQSSSALGLLSGLFSLPGMRHALPPDPHMAHIAVSLKSAEMSLLNEAPPWSLSSSCSTLLPSCWPHYPTLPALPRPPEYLHLRATVYVLCLSYIICLLCSNVSSTRTRTCLCSDGSPAPRPGLAWGGCPVRSCVMNEVWNG